MTNNKKVRDLDDFFEAYFYFPLLIKCPKSTFSENYGAFRTFLLVRARTSSKKFCAGLLMLTIEFKAPGPADPQQSWRQ